MHKRYTLAQAVLAALFLSSIRGLAKDHAVKCEVNPGLAPRLIAIRDAPNSSARVLQTVPSDTTEFHEVDIVSRGPKNDDWIKVESGGGAGWVNARGLECRLSAEEAKKQISARTESVVQALQRKDMDALAAFVHPIKGVRFSPSATVGSKANVVLTAETIRQWLTGSTRQVWGSADGSGAPIRLAPAAYYAKFVYSRDFAKAPVIGFNTFEAKSTDRNNTWEVYPNALVVEYYFPPSAPAGNDWASLRLVYEKNEGRWFLSGIIHDAWTI